MLTQDQINNILNALYRKTKEDKIIWDKSTSLNKTTYMTLVGFNNDIRLSYVINTTGNDYIFTINGKENYMDEVNFNELIKVIETKMDTEQYNKIINELEAL